jgi:hypothetical protein
MGRFFGKFLEHLSELQELFGEVLVIGPQPVDSVNGGGFVEGAVASICEILCALRAHMQTLRGLVGVFVMYDVRILGGSDRPRQLDRPRAS